MCLSGGLFDGLNFTEEDEVSWPAPSESARQKGDDAVSCGLTQLPIEPQSLSERLETCGFVAFDNAAGVEYCSAVRQEIMLLFEAGMLGPSKNKLATKRSETGTVSDGHELPKIGVFELDLVVNGEVCAPHALSIAPCINKFWLEDGQKLVDSLTAACPILELRGIDQIKVQYNNGSGGCFPMHYDSSNHSEREMTALLYLNESWQEGDGGELRLFPFPLAPVDVAPLNDRLAIFHSTEMLHRVMPANKSRVCLSMWFARAKYAKKISLPQRLPRELEFDDPLQVMKIMFNATNRRLFSKVLFAAEWEQSFRDAFGDTAQVEEALTLNASDVQAAQAVLARVNPELMQLVQSTLPLPVPETLKAPIVCKQRRR